MTGPVTKPSHGRNAANGLKPLPFTLKDIRDVIPAHCFERSALTSFAYLLRDFVMLGALGASIFMIDAIAPVEMRFIAWAVYWVLAGWVMTGVWIIGHECGHQAFSESKWLNDSVGWVLHSALFLPYHSWRISHSHHHAATNSMEDDAVFVPTLRSEEPPRRNPVVAALQWIFGLILIGFPLYLTVNVSGPPKYRKTGKSLSHFAPGGAIFTPAQWSEVAVSVLGVLYAAIAVAFAVRQWGMQAVAAYYGVPLFVVYADLVILTLLQHTDVFVPHYRAPAFTWLRGALCTVDRKYGFGIETLWHHISDTHVVHHLFSTIPFYHASEATEAVKGILGEHYLFDPTPIPVALWRVAYNCRFVEDSGDVLMFKGPASASSE